MAYGHCHAGVHARVDPRNDLMLEYGNGDVLIDFSLIKAIMDSRCFCLMCAEIEDDARCCEIRRTIEGGGFMTRNEHDPWRSPQPLPERIVVRPYD